jgi:1-acyl-sn-glycerol-3-phosphate acyltransferase
MARKSPLGEDPFLRIHFGTRKTSSFPSPSFPGERKSPPPRVEKKVPPPFRKNETVSLEELREEWEKGMALLQKMGVEKSLLLQFWERIIALVRYLSPSTLSSLYNHFFLLHPEVDPDPFGYDPKLVEEVSAFMDFLYKKWWRVQVVGGEGIPPSGPGIVVANRSGFFPVDGIMIREAVLRNRFREKPVRFLVENDFYYFPFLGVFLYRYGAIRASSENALRCLRNGELIAVFPEGIQGIRKLYRQRYQLQRFARGGPVRLALMERVPIIPAGVIGAEEIYPLLSRIDLRLGPLPFLPITPTFPWLGLLGLIPLPSRWGIVFGEPFVDHLSYSPQEVTNPLLINQLTLKLRRTIHEYIYEFLHQRKHLFF